MKRALIVAVDDYRHLGKFGGVVANDAFQFADMLKNADFGGFAVSACVDGSFLAMDDSIRRFFDDARKTDELVLYYSGHGKRTPDSFVRLTAYDTSEAYLDSTTIPSRTLLQLALKSQARRIAIILDCCFGVGLLAEAARLDGQSSERGPEHKVIEILCSGDESYVRSGGSVFTQTIMQGIRNGTAGSLKPHVTMRDIAEYLEIDGTIPRGRNYRRIGPSSPTEPEPLLLSRNPFRYLNIAKRILNDLHSRDHHSAEGALSHLIARYNASRNEESAAAGEIIANFVKRPTVPPQLLAMIPRALLPHAPTTANRRDPEPFSVIYNTRNSHWAELATVRISGRGYRPNPVDLNHTNRRYSKVFEAFEISHPVLWIVDEELVDHLPARYPDLFSALSEAPHDVLDRHLILRVEKGDGAALPHPLSRVKTIALGEESVESICDRLLGADLPLMPVAAAPEGEAVSPPRITPRPDLFLRALERQREALDKRQQKDTERQRAYELHMEGVPIREPNFLIYSKGRDFVMAICDHDESVDEGALRVEIGASSPATLATPEQVEQLGFVDCNVDPMFLDPHHQIKHIFVDANIFFQYIMFPQSQVVVPRYAEGSDKKKECTISSFMRTLLQLHGERKVVFANITSSKRFNDKILRELFVRNQVFTRFAPTPSNSLHMGSLRTALISFLFANNSNKMSRFHIRFDDTNPSLNGEANKAVILDDLRWIGIDGAYYSQTDDHARENYDTVLELLRETGFCSDQPDGSVALDIEAISKSVTRAPAYWFDMRRGPQILNHIPKVSSNKKSLDYSLTWSRKSGEAHKHKYKLAGAVDDMMHNSLVIRDIRQDHSAFTARQSIIMSCVREGLAFPGGLYATQVSKRAERHLKSKGRRANHGSLRPMPFPCPPMYLHVSRVCDESGKVLSKRNMSGFSIAQWREQGVYFPETILFWCICSLGGGFLKAVGYPVRDALLRDLARQGVSTFLAHMRDRVTVQLLLDAQQSDTIRIGGLARTDRLVLAQMSQVLLKRFIKRILDLNGLALPEGDPDFVQRLHELRAHFGGAHEVSDFVLTWARLTAPGQKLPLFYGKRLDEVGSSVAQLSKFKKKRLRKLLMGRTSGPQVHILWEIIGLRRAAKQRVEGDATHA